MTIKNSKSLNIMVIGLGNHARRIYIPTLYKYLEKYNLRVYGVDLSSSKEVVERYFSHNPTIPFMEFLFLDTFSAGDDLPNGVKKIMDNYVKKNNIHAVIISTDPLSHKMYAKWALGLNLHILMDKPITTRKNVANDIEQAMALEKDYDELVKLYQEKIKFNNLIFSINTQRRYEVGFKKVFSLIKEVADKFNVPVTSIQAMLGDGVWIFPDEIVEQRCHPYNEGYGKCSHSGFHLFDMVWKFLEAGKVKSKFPDKAQVYTSFLMPEGGLININQSDYSNYFGREYFERSRRDERELIDKYRDYGESDAFSNVRLLKNGVTVCNISINLLHNTVSGRSWPVPAQDLYKGNGRIRHQAFYINQGPFQSIQIHNYQSKSDQKSSNEGDYDLGGNNHFEIYVFRNSAFFGKETKAVEVYRLKELAAEDNPGGKMLYHEVAKDAVVVEFLDSIIGKVSLSDQTSNLLTYRFSVQLMSSIYKSHVGYRTGTNLLVDFPMTYE